jgi:autotransporter-associated beta strand protein
LDGEAPGTLRAAIFAANAFSGPATINFAGSPQTLSASADLPPINNRFGVTINGNGWTLAGSSSSNATGNRGLFFGVGTGEAFSSLQATTSTPYAINNLKLTNFRARGGDGGGGGAGLGGAIFLNAGSLTLTGVTLGSNRAIGGNGGTELGQGGGGMGGNGGITTVGHGTGGGGFGATAHGGNMVVAGGFTLPTNGATGNYSGARDGGTGGSTPSGQIDAPGFGGFKAGGGGFGGYSLHPTGFGPWYGGGGGGGVNGGTGGGELATIGGGGGFGGGGGGGGVLDGQLPAFVQSSGGQGGFGGGGGSAGTDRYLSAQNQGNGGNGGFGGGGGRSSLAYFAPTPSGGTGGFGAGSGTPFNSPNPQGGGGLGAGGSIFIRQGANLTINDGTWLGGDVVAGGTGGNNGQGLGAAVFLGGSLNYSVSAANTVVLPQDLGGGTNAQITGGLTKSGPGTLVLASSLQTFTGGITISGGTLQIGNAGTAADLRFAGNIVNNSVFTFDHSNNLSTAIRISGTGTFVKNGTGTLSLNNLNTYTGGTVVNAGILILGVGSALPAGSAYTVNGGTLSLTNFDPTLGSLAGTGGTVSIGTRTLTIGDGSSTVAAAAITGTTGRLVKQGTGTLTLSGSNNFGGGVTVTAGTLATGSNNALPTSGDVSILGGTLDLAGTSPTIGILSFDRPATAARTVANSGASNASLTVNGGITFNGGNTPIHISAGLNSASGQLTVDDPTGFSFELPSPPVLSGRISGPGGLTKNSSFLTIALSASNTYAGPTIVNGGAILLAATNTLPATTAVTLNSASLNLAPANNTNITAGNYNQTIGSLASATSDSGINLGSATLTVGDATSTTFAGQLAGTAGQLVKQGAGTLTLSGLNSHTGGTTVNGGTVLLAGIGKVSADGSPLAVNTGGTLNLGNKTVITGQVNNSGSGVGTITNGTLNLNGNNLFFRSGTLDANLTGTGTSRIWLGGDAAGTLLLGGTNTVQYTDNNSTIIGHPITGAAGIVRLASPTALGPANIGGNTIEAQLFTGTLDAGGQSAITVGSLRLQSGPASKLINSNTSAAASFTGTVTLVANGTDIGGPGTLRFSAPLAGAGGFNKTGPGTVILAAANSYTGPTVVSSGLLELNSTGFANSTSSITISGASAAAPATLRLSGTDRFGNGAVTSTVPITVGPFGTLASNGTYNTIISPTLTGGTILLNGGLFADFPAFGLKGTLAVTGSTPSQILTGTGIHNTINIGPTNAPGSLTFNVANVTASAAADLTIAAPLQNNALESGGTNINGLTKTGPGTLVLAAANTYTGPTTISAGTLQIGSGGTTGSLAGPIANNAALVFNRASDLTLPGLITGTGSLTKLGTGTLTLAADQAAPYQMSSLTISAGAINLTNNDLLLNYTTTSPISILIGYLNAATLTANGDQAGLPTTLAIAESADLGLTEFNSIPVDDTTVIAKYTYVGDANLDGQVDALDYERIDLAIGNTGVLGTAQGDLNYDGNVDALDYEQVDLNIGNGVGSPLSQVFIPEPSSLTTLAALPLLALRRRK